MSIDTPGPGSAIPWWRSLAARFALVSGGLALLAVLAGGMLVYRENRRQVLEDFSRGLEHNLEVAAVKFDGAVHAVLDDVRFLSRLPVLRRYAEAAGDDDAAAAERDEVVEGFRALLEGRPSFFQVRLIAAESGFELVRLENREGLVTETPRSELQDKADRDYFREGVRLGDDEIYLSRIDLNREHGVVSPPLTPTLRAGRTLRRADGRLFGLLVVNMDVSALFAELQRLTDPRFRLYLADGHGEFLVHPDPGRAFAFEFGDPPGLVDEFGDPPGSREAGAAITRFRRIQVGEGTQARRFTLGVAVPGELVAARLAALRRRIVLGSTLGGLLAAGAAVGATALVTRRLRRVSEAIAGFQPGGALPELPAGPTDEVAVVGRKFRRLASEVNEKIASLEAARVEAEQATRARDDFLAMMSHEIRTPLNAIVGLTGALEGRDGGRAGPDPGTLAAIRQSARNLDGLLEDVLRYARLKGGEVEVRQEPFALRAAVESVVSGFRKEALDRGLRLSASIAADVPPRVRGDPLRLFQILHNLVHNALKFTERGSVAVSVDRISEDPAGAAGTGARGEPDGDRDAVVPIAFTVRDTGIGMTRDDLRRSFEWFGQTGGERSQRAGGSGLGLAIAKMLVEKQGGRLEAESDAGQGTTFRFVLPFRVAGPAERGRHEEGQVEGEVEGKERGPLPPAEAAARIAGSRLLCVEDVAFNRQVLSAMLEPLGAELVFAGSGRETHSLLADDGPPFAAVLLDLGLPDVDGVDLLRRLRARHPALPVVVVTAHSSDAHREACRDAGAAGFVEKPIERDELEGALGHALSRRRTEPATETADRSSGGGAPVSEAAGSSRCEPVSLGRLRRLFEGDEARLREAVLDVADDLDKAADEIGSATGADAGGAGTAEVVRAARHRLTSAISLLDLDEAAAALDPDGCAASDPSNAAAVLRDLAGRLRASVEGKKASPAVS